jgi:hypothetical protein
MPAQAPGKETSMMTRRHVLWLILGLLVLAYFLQLFTPLRTNTDAITFLEIAASASDGHGFLTQGEPSHYPPGYPLLLVGLDRVGLACSAVLVGLNLLSLAIGLVSAAYILHRSFRLEEEAILTIMILTLLCWVLIKHVTLPISDIPYLGVGLASVAVLTWAEEVGPRRKPFAIAIGLMASGLGLSIRTIGIALLPAVAVAVVGPPRTATGRLRIWLGGDWRRWLLVTVGMLGAVVAGFVVLSRTKYVHEMAVDWRGWIMLGRYRLGDWGELLVNTSLAKLPERVYGPVLLLGILAGLWVALGLAARRRVEVVDAYVGTYVGILLVWPYEDARFWLPVFPLLVAYAWKAYQSVEHWPGIRWAARAYVGAYALFGVAALVYSSWLSLSGDRFGERYGAGVYRASYREVYGSGQGVHPDPKADPSDPRVVSVLKRYRLRWVGSPSPSQEAREAGEMTADPEGRTSQDADAGGGPEVGDRRSAGIDTTRRVRTVARSTRG